jgi:hypothetical protein
MDKSYLFNSEHMLLVPCLLNPDVNYYICHYIALFLFGASWDCIAGRINVICVQSVKPRLFLTAW